MLRVYSIKFRSHENGSMADATNSLVCRRDASTAFALVFACLRKALATQEHSLRVSYNSIQDAAVSKSDDRAHASTLLQFPFCSHVLLLRIISSHYCVRVSVA